MIDSIGGGMGNTQMLELRQKMMDQMKDRFKNADTDGTEGLSQNELSALGDSLKSQGLGNNGFVNKLQENFDKIDTDGNGQLGKEEMNSAKGSIMPEPPHGFANKISMMFQNADTDGTKGVSMSELSSLSNNLKSNGVENTDFIDKMQEVFSEIDADGNGQLTQSEMNQFKEAQGPGGSKGSQGAAKGGGGESGSESSDTTEIVYEDGQAYEVTTDASGIEISRSQLDSVDIAA